MTDPSINPSKMKYVVQESESSQSDELQNYKLINQNKKVAKKQAGNIKSNVNNSLTDIQNSTKKRSADTKKSDDAKAEDQKPVNIETKDDTNTEDEISNSTKTDNDENSEDESTEDDTSLEKSSCSKKTKGLSTSEPKDETNANSKKMSSNSKKMSYFDDNTSFDLKIDQKKSKNVEVINYNTKTKRTKKNWTDEEVEFLKLGIKKYKGELNMWSKILKAYNFNDRTTTDLKDKHRNVTKKTSYHTHTNKPFCLVDEKGEPVKNYNGDVLTYYQKFPYDAAVRIANYNNMKNDLDFNVCILGSKYPIYTYTAISQENGSVIIRAKKATYK